MVVIGDPLGSPYPNHENVTRHFVVGRLGAEIELLHGPQITLGKVYGICFDLMHFEIARADGTVDPVSVGLCGEEDLLEILDTLPNGVDRVVLPHQEGAVVAVDRHIDLLKIEHCSAFRQILGPFAHCLLKTVHCPFGKASAAPRYPPPKGNIFDKCLNIFLQTHASALFPPNKINDLHQIISRNLPIILCPGGPYVKTCIHGDNVLVIGAKL